jgi:EmrB/QacA subfamily drug resistance transporter
MIVIVLVAVDATVVSTAMPHIVSEIGGVGGYAWVFSAYLIAQTVTIPIYGKLSDVRGRRAMILISLACFVGGSALCGFSQSMDQLIAFRVVQGIGAGGLLPLVQATVADLIPPADRGRYQGLLAGAFGSASVAGPVVGGLIVDHASWRWIFFLNLPIGTAAAAVTAVTMPPSRPRSARRRSVDWLGAWLLMTGVTALLLALIWVGDAAAGTRADAAFAIAAVTLAWFAVHERSTADPILPFSALKSGPVTISCIGYLVLGMCTFGAIAYLPLFAQGVIGVSAASAGAVLTPFMLGIVASAFTTGQVVARTGQYRAITIAGTAVFVTGLMLLWRMGLNATPFVAARNMFICGIGAGVLNPILTLTAQNAVPNRIVGATTAFINFCRAMGSSLGASLFGLLVASRLPSVARGGALDHQLPLSGRIGLIGALRPAFGMAAMVSIVLLVVITLGLKQVPLRQSVTDESEGPLSLAPTLEQ